MADICRLCGSRAVFWARTEAGRAMLVDSVPDPRGNVVILPVRVGRATAIHVLTKAERETDDRRRFYAHVVWCGKIRPPLPSRASAADRALPEPAQGSMLAMALVADDDGQLAVRYEPLL